MSAASAELRGLIGQLRKSSPACADHLATIRKIGMSLDASIAALEERVAQIKHLDWLRSTTGELRP